MTDFGDSRNKILQGSGDEKSVPASMADFDENEFRSHLNGLDISDEQASELMRIV